MRRRPLTGRTVRKAAKAQGPAGRKVRANSMSELEPRRRGRPPGAKNRPKVLEGLARGVADTAAAPSTEPSSSPALAVSTTRSTLEADRDRLLKGIEECKQLVDPASGKTVTDWKTVAALQSQLNGVNRMLLRITGETAPTDANLIRAPQYLRLKADLIAVLKKHPAALADVVAVFDTAER